MENPISERIRNMRKRFKLSQQTMAKEMGIRQQTISSWEIGEYAPSPIYEKAIWDYFERKSSEDREVDGDGNLPARGPQETGVNSPSS